MRSQTYVKTGVLYIHEANELKQTQKGKPTRIRVGIIMRTPSLLIRLPANLIENQQLTQMNRRRRLLYT